MNRNDTCFSELRSSTFKFHWSYNNIRYLIWDAQVLEILVDQLGGNISLRTKGPGLKGPLKTTQRKWIPLVLGCCKAFALRYQSFNPSCHFLHVHRQSTMPQTAKQGKCKSSTAHRQVRRWKGKSLSSLDGRGKTRLLDTLTHSTWKWMAWRLARLLSYLLSYLLESLYTNTNRD